MTPEEMSKQTSLDLYEKEINFLIEKYEAKEISKREFITMKHNLFYNAKEMEKEQKIDAFNKGLSFAINPIPKPEDAKNYYKKRIKKTNDR
jgi:hypothetical protein